ncbi:MULTISPECIES: hypothetical protein [Pseudomonas putida group]|uniref:Uncharacterized protein n=1 Tax=Pseudomonas putida ND6 TaxID=231023 RepID=I3V1V1_PSEPU|nr:MULTISPECIES: hypothetical protein [Pseudomonas putida group]AFK71722.1 hypothetical protein YSA_09152 [Pseudomonas putida ND6]ANC80524.1 hypothetical protein KKK_05710 [Pseudomonas putida B6-2]MCE0992021.1 hypothetical protein [Pseudomonas alloputida]QKL07030.1 hypothetical protein GEV41_11590 [Pseudomonas putida]QNG10020.1 hypothetical protein GPM17_16955 [Pseudomonas putida]
MTSKLIAPILAGALLLALGGAGGVWLAAGHYRPLLDDSTGAALNCQAARDNLSGLAQEQGKALGDLTLAAIERQAAAEKAVTEAMAGAQGDYAAANRLQQERTGGDQCEAAISIIDKELGL